MEAIIKNLPGVFTCIVIAVLSSHLGGQIPLIGGPVFALFSGIILNPFIKSDKRLSPVWILHLKDF